MAGVIDHYRDVRETQSTAEQLLMWETVRDSARDLAFTLLHDGGPTAPSLLAVTALAATLIEQVKAPWES